MSGTEWDASCADVELRRLQDGFSPHDFTEFAKVLMTGYATALTDVHVLTGRLRASGRAEVEVSTSERWEGEISFGGDGVRWAASEFFGYSPRHGGYPSHAYFKKLGWQPTPRAGVDGDVPWSQNPIGAIPRSGIDADMLAPVADFISRGRHTPHPEGRIR